MKMNKYRKQRIISNIKGAIISPLFTLLFLWFVVNEDFIISKGFFILLFIIALFSWGASWLELYEDLFSYDSQAEVADKIYERETK